MPEIKRLVYISRATFVPNQKGARIELDVARIVMQARRNNTRLGVAGAIYYSDGCFLQCLEGESRKITALSSRIKQDPRHCDMKVLSRHRVEAASFSAWPMKLVTQTKAIRDFLERHQRTSFDPYTFDKRLTAAMIDLLRECEDGVFTDDDQSGTNPASHRATGPAGDTPANPAEGMVKGTKFLSWLRTPR